MVKFSCFQAHILSHKNKKTIRQSAESMKKTLEDQSRDCARMKFSYSEVKLEPCLSKTLIDNYADNLAHSSPTERYYKSDETENKYNSDNDIAIHKNALIKTSQSLGSGSNLKERISGSDGSDHAFSYDEVKNDSISNNEKINGGTFEAYNCVVSAKDWIIPASNGITNMEKGQSSCYHWDEISTHDFRLKRIHAWINDLHLSNPLEDSESVIEESIVSKLKVKVNPGSESAKRYISSLNASSTAAHMTNLGLIMIPFLSAFVSLKALNLSGNAIVRINGGALPRGLHVLNLSKNSISAIEGLRELTRLRVLDLSYNRILRIGHGLSGCTSIKELYLAGNKISEVEGLHRLLKLNVLDLRFNKISTTKCLGQLAANYNCLQALSLEGNPVQKNVGDEQVKKYVQNLLTRLTYYNRQSIKVGTMKKDTTSKSRKGTHGIVAQTVSSFSTHGRKKSQGVVSSNLYRNRHGHLPPVGVKMTFQGRRFVDFRSKVLRFKDELSIRRS